MKKSERQRRIARVDKITRGFQQAILDAHGSYMDALAAQFIYLDWTLDLLEEHHPPEEIHRIINDMRRRVKIIAKASIDALRGERELVN